MSAQVPECPKWCTKHMDHGTEDRDLRSDPVMHTGPFDGHLVMFAEDHGEGVRGFEVSVEHGVWTGVTAATAKTVAAEIRELAQDAEDAAQWLEDLAEAHKDGNSAE